MLPQLSKKLNRSFYCRPTLEIASELIGCHIIFKSPKGRMAAKIVEVEAYVGEDDPACHAANGKTARNEIMYSRGGFAYVYFIYGMYYCFNIVTGNLNSPEAILIRGAEPIDGIDLFRKKSPASQHSSRWLAGPGKFCRAFGLTSEQNGLDLTKKTIYLKSRIERPDEIIRTKRIGISKGKNLLYRFIDSKSKSISMKNISKRIK